MTGRIIGGAKGRHVSASVNYCGDSREPRYIYYYQPPDGGPHTNIEADPHTVKISDVRGLSHRPTLGREGMEFVCLKSLFADFYDPQAVRERYFPELSELLRDRVGGEHIVYWNHALRRPDHGTPAGKDIPLSGTLRRPLAQIHGDATPASVEANIRQAVGDEAGDMMKLRYRFFNFWRPIEGPLTDRPLALCDVTTVANDDVVPITLRVEQGESEIYGYRFNPAHSWHYMSEMRPDEGVLFASYDSATPPHQRVVPHTAFDDPLCPADGLPRHSVEMRFIVFG